MNNTESLHGNLRDSLNHSLDGEENKSLKRKPSKTPRTPTKMAKMKEKPGSLFLFLRLFSMSYTVNTVDTLIIFINTSQVSVTNTTDNYYRSNSRTAPKKKQDFPNPFFWRGGFSFITVNKVNLNWFFDKWLDKLEPERQLPPY